MKPNFFILTFPKTGSTSLYETLREHKDICLPHKKENWFFINEYHKGIEWYEEKFWHCRGQGKAVGEVNTGVLLKDEYIERLKKTVFDPKIVIILRDPVQRTISHYYHLVRMGLEKRSIETALCESEQDILQHDFNYIYKFGYVSFSLRYKSALERVKSLFDEEKIKIFLYEELLEDSSKVLRELQNFLEITPVNLSLKRKNVSRIPKNSTFKVITATPLFLYKILSRNQILHHFVHVEFKRRTRGLRSLAGQLLERVAEIGYQRFEKPPLSTTPRLHIEDLYNQKLKGLDTITNIPIQKYWPWYDPRGHQ